jgi:hypothetical protein
MKKELTYEQVKNWLDSDITKRYLIDIIITDIANGIYKPTQLYNDVLNFIEKD